MLASRVSKDRRLCALRQVPRPTREPAPPKERPRMPLRLDARTPAAVRRIERLCAEADSQVLRDALRQLRRDGPHALAHPDATAEEAAVRELQRRSRRQAERNPTARSLDRGSGIGSSWFTGALLAACVLGGLSLAAPWATQTSTHSSRTGTAGAAMVFRTDFAVPSAASITAWSLAELVAAASEAEPARYIPAINELARRGEFEQLAPFRHDARKEVRLLVPQAVARGGRAAHQQLPWLAEGLDSSEREVRAATVAALEALTAEFGPYRFPEGPRVPLPAAIR